MSCGPTPACALLAVALMVGAAGCASQPPATSTTPATTPSARPAATDTTGTAGLVPAGFGTLRQDDIAVKLLLPGVQVKITPLDENVIRTLSPDSYRTLREIAESRRATVTRLASQHGLQRVGLWYILFYGLAPDARFSPLELTINSAGHDYRPVEIIPISTGFGEQRLQPRETQHALYLFEDGLDVNQPLVVSLGSERSTSWSDILRSIERERSLIRSRAKARAAP